MFIPVVFELFAGYFTRGTALLHPSRWSAAIAFNKANKVPNAPASCNDAGLSEQPTSQLESCVLFHVSLLPFYFA